LNAKELEKYPAPTEIFSMLLVLSERCLHALSVLSVASIFSMGGTCANSSTWKIQKKRRTQWFISERTFFTS
jgi:hypothetical protein